jgi:glycosyltransferase involved in cell wall biosynthesis
MDRDMPPRVTYWTGIWDPTREALSKEVQTLRRALQPGAPVVSVSAGQRSSIAPRDRVVRLAGQRWMAFRAAAALVEPLGTVTHAVGAMNAWHLLRSLGRRPLIFTVALPGPALEPALYEKVAIFAAESECLAHDLRSAGIGSDRIRVIYPGVNLDEYRPVTRRSHDRFRVLFASAPSDAGEFRARGIPLLVEVARLCPEIDVTLLWRSWGDQDSARRAFANLNPPENIHIELRRGRTMTSVYQETDAIACLYEPGFGKSCPNSIVEALACGVPALVSDSCGVAGLITKGEAGIAATRNPADVAEAARTLRREHARFSAAARRLAERSFDVRQFVDAYADLYQSTAGTVAAPGRPGVLPLGMSRRTPAGQRGR